MYRHTPSRQVYVLPSEDFWRLVYPFAQPYMRLGIPMTEIVQIAGEAINTYSNVPGNTPISGSLSSRGSTYQKIHHLDAVRNFITDSLRTLFPEMLYDRREMERLTFSLVDCIPQIRDLLCDYAKMMTNCDPRTMRIDRFLGPSHDLALSFETRQPILHPYENPDAIRSAFLQATGVHPSQK